MDMDMDFEHFRNVLQICPLSLLFHHIFLLEQSLSDEHNLSFAFQATTPQQNRSVVSMLRRLPLHGRGIRKNTGNLPAPHCTNARLRVITPDVKVRTLAKFAVFPKGQTYTSDRVISTPLK